MKAPYQIERHDMGKNADLRYCFVLLDTRKPRALAFVCNAYGNSPIAPPALRNYQARLNTAAMLD